MGLRRSFENNTVDHQDEEILKSRRSFFNCFSQWLIPHTRSEIYNAVIKKVKTGLDKKGAWFKK